MVACKQGHPEASNNRTWKSDRRMASGGHWVCRKCHELDLQLRSEKRKQRRNRANRRLYAERNANTVKRKYSGPRQIAELAAELIVEANQDPTVSAKVFAEFVPQIAAGALRYTSNATRVPNSAEISEARERIEEAVIRLMASDRKNPLKHLHVKPGAERSWDRFNKALADAANASTLEERRKHPLPNCHGKPELYSEYDDDSIPTEEEAYALCFGCPLIELCAAFAEEEQPAWGVWSGEVFGRPSDN